MKWFSSITQQWVSPIPTWLPRGTPTLIPPNVLLIVTWCRDFCLNSSQQQHQWLQQQPDLLESSYLTFWAAAHKNTEINWSFHHLRVPLTTHFHTELSLSLSLWRFLVYCWCFWRGAGVLLMVPLMDPWMLDLTGIWGLWGLWQSLGLFAISLSSSWIARGHPTGSAGAMWGCAGSAVFRWVSEQHLQQILGPSEIYPV